MLFEINAHFKEITGIRWKPKNLCYNLNSHKLNTTILILSTSLDCSAKIWDLVTHKCIFNFSHKIPVISLSWNLYENRFIIGLSCGFIIYIDFIKRKIIEKKTGEFGVFDINSHSMSNIFSLISSNRLICI